MKIMFVVDAMTKGGAQRVISNLSNYLCNKYEMAIVSVYNTDVLYDVNNVSKIYYLDNEVTDIREKSKFFNKIKRFNKRIKNLNEYKREFKPDIILSFLPLSCYISLISKMFLNMKTVISVRNDPKIEYKSKKDKLLMKLLYPKADGYIFQTEEAKRYFNKKIQDNSIIIPNPINEIFKRESYVEEREKIIVSVGKLEEQKNQMLLIKAFQEVEKKYNNYKLIIYGEGSLREKFEAEIEKIGLKGKILLPGISNDLKEELYKKKMFILSSDYEGMPNALMEAMALGLPVISTNCPCGGPEFLIKDGINGILVPVNNKDKLVEAMLKLIENEIFSRKIGIEATKISEDLAPKKINEIWENYILSIIKK